MIDAENARIRCAYCGATVPVLDTEAVFWQAQKLPAGVAMEIHDRIPFSLGDDGERPATLFNEPSGILLPPPTCSACWKKGTSG